MERTVMEDLAIWNSCWKEIHSVMLANFWSLTKKIFTVVTLTIPKNHQLYVTAVTKKDVATFIQSLMASVGHWKLDQ